MPKKAGIPQPRPMTRAEVREFRKAGLDPITWDDVTNNRMQEMIDWVLDNIYADYDLENEDYPDCVELVTETHNLTYGRKTEVKNSSTSGPGLPETEQSTAETA